MINYIGIIHFGLEFCVFLMSFAIAYVSWQLYLRDKDRAMKGYAFGFVLIGISGAIHSFNLTGDTHLGIMFIGRIVGYLLILWAINHPRIEKIKIFRPISILAPVFLLTPMLYFINTILCVAITYSCYKKQFHSRYWFTRNFIIGFILLSISELLFIFSNINLFWNIAHLFKLVGFSVLVWVFMRLPRLRIVDKLQIILRGMVLFSVISITIPLTILILYNIQKDAYELIERDTRRIIDYIEKDKLRILSTGKIIARTPLVENLFRVNRYKSDKNEAIQHLEYGLLEIGNDFILILDEDLNPILEIAPEKSDNLILKDFWLIERALDNHTVVAIKEDFIAPLTIVSSIPIQYNNKIEGILLTGVIIDDLYLKQIKKSLQLDIIIYQQDSLVASSYEMINKERLDAIENISSDIFNRVFKDKQIYLGETKFRDSSYFSAFAPLYGHHKQVVGMIFTGLSSAELEYRKSEILAILIFVSIPVTLFAYFLGIRLSRKITFSIMSLSNAAEEISNGNLDVVVPTISEDEISDLGRIFNQMTHKLKEIDTTKSDFYSFISHEIRTPLTALRGAAETIIEIGIDNISSEQKQMLKIITENAQRLSRLVDNLLELAKLEAGKMTFNKVLVDLDALIERSIETFSPLAQNKNIRLEYEKYNDSIILEGDSDWLTQVLNNLISNAIKYTPDDGQVMVYLNKRSEQIKDNGRIIVRNMAEIQIKDTGIGIPGNELEHIFDKYHQVQSSVKEPIKGTGLGLSICKYIIEEVHHGKISVKSKEGQGSWFSFTLPMN